MIRVAICDDDKHMQESLSNYLLDYSIQCDREIDHSEFDTCEELMDEYLKGNSFDVILLDIEFKNNDWKNGEIPKVYQLQVQHYMAVTGFQKAYIAVLVGGNKFYWTEVYRDEQLIKMLVSMESHFWHCVRGGEEPDVDASKATSLYLGAKYNNAKVGSVIDLDEQMLSAIEKYEQIKIELDSLTEQKRLVENQLKSALAENEAGRVGGHIVKWKPIVQTRIDSNKLKKEHKEVYDACKKEVSYRKFSVA